MYVYNDYWSSRKALLLYPAQNNFFEKDIDFDSIQGSNPHHSCALGKVSIFKEGTSQLDETIGTTIISKWLRLEPFKS
ncbi:MAG: hypothetical protein M0D53_04170 [Flavobacterium sp. JAD_PAG50586_2]|nr:MAG: hypothetical protein M0D53_04170 [Flavobacterium sp. JAD_PAG50586_2]